MTAGSAVTQLNQAGHSELHRETRWRAAARGGGSREGTGCWRQGVGGRPTALERVRVPRGRLAMGGWASAGVEVTVRATGGSSVSGRLSARREAGGGGQDSRRGEGRAGDGVGDVERRKNVASVGLGCCLVLSVGASLLSQANGALGPPPIHAQLHAATAQPPARAPLRPARRALGTGCTAVLALSMHAVPSLRAATALHVRRADQARRSRSAAVSPLRMI